MSLSTEFELMVYCFSPVILCCRLLNLACSPTEPVFLCSAAPSQAQGRLLLFDIKTKQLQVKKLIVFLFYLRNERFSRLFKFKTYVFQRSFNLNGGQNLTANCFAFNHNGQFVAVGCSDGSVQIFDIRRGSLIDSWPAHSGAAFSVQLTPDDTACYTAGSDNKVLASSNLFEHLICHIL